MSTIHILEDSKDIISVYRSILADRYDVFTYEFFAEFKEVMQKIGSVEDSIAILDLNLNEGYLWDLMLGFNMPIPFMVSSARYEEDTIRLCYRRGAIDYLVKPLISGELLAKVERCFGSPIKVDLVRRIVKIGKIESEELTNKELAIINAILTAPDEKISKDLLVNGKNTASFEVHLVSLRKKLRNLSLVIELDDERIYRIKKS